jgi:hypothetical protein
MINNNKFLQKLIIFYFDTKGLKNTQTNKSTTEETELQVNEEESKLTNNNILKILNINITDKYKVYQNLKIEMVIDFRDSNYDYNTMDNSLTDISHYNNIIFCCNMHNITTINKLFILYDKISNNIYIFDTISFNYFLSYNDINNFYDKFILISLVNNISYGRELFENQINIIKIIITNIIQNIIDSKNNLGEDELYELNNLYKISLKQQIFINNNQQVIDDFNKKYSYILY